MIPPMRRLARHLFTLCSAASLVLCVALGGLWIHSHGYLHQAAFARGRHMAWLYSQGGSLQLVWTVAWPAHDVPLTATMKKLTDAQTSERLAAGSDWQAGGFGVGHTEMHVAGRIIPTRYRTLTVPYWLPFLLTTALPVIRLVRAHRRGLGMLRADMGRCPACGYDLRASPGRCPECGTPAV